MKSLGGEVDAILDTGCKSTVCGELFLAWIVIGLSQSELKRMKDTRKESNKVSNFGTVHPRISQKE